MIRRLTEADRKDLVQYLQKEETLNIYFLDSIAMHGFEKEFLEIYGEFDERNQYQSILLLFRKTSILYYSHSQVFSNEWVEMLEAYDLTYLSCDGRVLGKISAYFKYCNVLTYYIAEATELIEEYAEIDDRILEMTTEEEFEKLYNLLKPFHEFENRTSNAKDFIERRRTYLEFGNNYYIEENGKMISSASIYRHIENTAIVCMVATVVEERNRGLATLLMKHLMHEHIVKNQKTLCLFYDNPTAGNMYRRLGFKDAYEWKVLVIK